MEDSNFKIGDTFTIAGVCERNPAWRWWAFWRSKHIDKAQTFTVKAISERTPDGWVDAR